LSSTTRQFELEEVVAPGAEDDDEELLELCAMAAVVIVAIATARTIVFMAMVSE